MTTQQPVLVTGATGFIGGALVRRLIERHCPVTCLVRANSRTDDLRALGAQLVTGDVTDHASVARALTLSQARVVFHLAGLVKAQRFADFTNINAQGVENVAAACAGCASPPILIVVSSLAAAGPCEAEQLHVESDSPSPISNYGRSKLAGEQAAAKFAKTVPITIVRPPIVFGPGDQGVLQIFRPIAQWGLHLVPGPRKRNRRFSLIHVDDLVQGLLLTAEKGERMREQKSPHSVGQGIYFFSDEENPTYAQLGQAIAKALEQKPPTVIHIPAPLMKLIGITGDLFSQIRRRPGWISSDKITEALAGSWTCSSAKARTQLGWSPAASLPARLHETALWYRQSRWL